MSEKRDAAFFRRRWHEITSSPEHQRRRVIARTRALYMLIVGLPVAVAGILACDFFGVLNPIAAALVYAGAVTIGWWVGSRVARKKLADAAGL